MQAEQAVLPWAALQVRSGRSDKRSRSNQVGTFGQCGHGCTPAKQHHEHGDCTLSFCCCEACARRPRARCSINPCASLDMIGSSSTKRQQHSMHTGILPP